jgi:hypothetical protein
VVDAVSHLTQSEARAVLRKHAGWDDCDSSGLIGFLRPYRELRSEFLVEIVQAVHTLLDEFRNPHVDAELVRAAWDITFTARQWTRGPHEPMFHGRNFISAVDKTRLDDWLYAFENWVLRLLNTSGPLTTFDWLVFQRIGGAERLGFAMPIILERISDGMDCDPDFEHDDKIPYCELLTAMGPAGGSAVGLLEELMTRTKSQEVRHAAHRALKAVRY